ncbi:hypothetical protein HK405_009173 [Cladochytrium tenue]|nr:hypothetical protein HK405_009173 [Cladochytrium tenue]
MVEEVEIKQSVDGIIPAAVEALPDDVEVKDALPAEPPLPTLPPLVKTLVFDVKPPAGPDADNADAGTTVAEDVVTRDTVAAAAPEGSVVTAALNGDSAAPPSGAIQVNHVADGGEGTTNGDSASGLEAVAVDVTKHVEVERAEGERQEAEAEVASDAQRDKQEREEVVKTQAVDSAVSEAPSKTALVVERQSTGSATAVAEVAADATGTAAAATPPPDRADPPSRASFRHSMFAAAPGSAGSSSRTGSSGALLGQLRRRQSSASSLASLVPAPAARTAAGGPVVPTAAVTGAVRATNPILDELLHALQLLAADDAELVVLDLRDCAVFAPPHAAAVAEALATNSHLRELVLENTGLQTAAAVEIANALRVNETLEVLNLDSNNIAPAGIKALAESLEYNRGLRELRLANQRSMAGTDAEQAFARAMAKNTTLTRLSLLFRDVASRGAVDRAIARNRELARRARRAAANPISAAT